MNAPWNNEDLRRAFDADFDALVAFASRSKARVGFAFLRAVPHTSSTTAWLPSRAPCVRRTAPGTPRSCPRQRTALPPFPVRFCPSARSPR